MHFRSYAPTLLRSVLTRNDEELKEVFGRSKERFLVSPVILYDGVLLHILLLPLKSVLYFIVP